MKVVLGVKGFKVTPEGKTEECYVKEMLDSLLFDYKDTEITTWEKGIKIVGRKGD